MTISHTAIVLRARADVLMRVADRIDVIPPVGEDEFRDAVGAVIAAGVRPIDIARRFKVEPSTITRWLKGASPHPIARRSYAPLLSRLARLAEHSLRDRLDDMAEAA